MALRELRGAAIVTGGASGLGRAVVERLAAEGMSVVIADVKEEAGAELVQRLGGPVAFRATDVTDPDAVQAAVDQAAGMHPHGLRLSVAVAGVGWAGRVLGRKGPHSVELFNSILAVNLQGTFHLLRSAAAAMAANEPIDEERGVHVSTASTAAFDGQVGQIAYSASKGGIVSMTLPAARDLAERGIRVNAIAPGVFDTPLTEGLPEETVASIGDVTPFPSRLGRPPEFADLVVALARNGMINAEVVRIDGALRMPPR